jgi:hypothetical protein
MKTLTEEQAWKVIERIFAYRVGICHAVLHLKYEGLISGQTEEMMFTRLHRERRALGKPAGSYYWPLRTTEDDDARRNFASEAARRAARTSKRKTRKAA